MKKGISRLRTRISIALLVIGVAGLLASMMREGWLMTGIGVALCIAAILLRPWGCPHCGKKIAPKPQWSEPGKYFCPYCGSRLAYDDEETQD